MSSDMHGISATSRCPSCTETVHVPRCRHAPKPCEFQTRCDLHHARVGVQHNEPHHAPQPCNLPCTPVGATQDNLYRTTKPVMHYVQDGRSTYRNLTTTTVDLPDHQGNHRPHARKEVATR